MELQSNALNEVSIRVNVQSEFDTLKTVVMRFANPYSSTWRDAASLLSRSVRMQLRANAWKDYNHLRVWEQQRALVQVIRDRGATVLFLDNIAGNNSQHYTRDIGFTIEGTFFVARMGSTYRRREQVALSSLSPGFPKVAQLSRGRIEGGDVMLHKQMVLVGLSEATDMEGVNELRTQLVQLDISREVVPLPFKNRGVIHLDTKFNILGESTALIARDHFRPETVRWLERHFDLIQMTSEESGMLEVNTLSISASHVVISKHSKRLPVLLHRKGLTPIPMDYSEVTSWPGSFRCTTLPIERAEPSSQLSVLA